MKPLSWKEVYQESTYTDGAPSHKDRDKRQRHRDRQQAKKEIRTCSKVPEYVEQEYIPKCDDPDCCVCGFRL